MGDRMTVYPEGGKSLVLTANDHLATGGEGSVYAKGDLVYKVYLDPAKAIRAGMERKVAVLAAFAHPGIAAPKCSLRDKHGNFIGLVLPKVRAEALCRAFTTGWRDLHQFALPETATTVDAMRDITAFAHQHQALMVDSNEMNWLLAGTAPTAIDVDSWQLPGFKATAIMPSIRDYANTTFSEGTDWFAWAVVTFQIWTGIHPYKGTHPDFNRAALEARMRAQASVFDAKVRLPGAARPVSDIPPALRAWYERVFQTNERTAPPSAKASMLGAQTAPRLQVRMTLSGALRIERLGNAGGRILAAFNGFVIARTAAGLQLWDAVARAALPQVEPEALAAVLRQEAAVIRTGFGRVLLLLEPSTGLLTMKGLEDQSQARLSTAAESLWQCGNRVFGVVPGVSNGLVELEATQLGNKPLLAVRHQWPVASLSTRLMRGVFLQDCLGMPFLGVLEGDGLLQGATPQLRGYRVAEGFAAGTANVWLSAIRVSDGETVRLQLALRAGRFELAEELVVSDLALDGATNPAGVAVLREGPDLVVAKGAAQKRLVDAGLADTMRLFSLGPAGIGAFEDSEVVKVSLA